MERFWSKVNKTETCWLWTASTNADGYGEFGIWGQVHKAHRIAFFLTYGYLPKEVRHKCDNPPCVRPDHLLPGTHEDNMRDMVVRGRSVKGEDVSWSKLTENQIRYTRDEMAKGRTCFELATELNTSESYMGRVRRRKVWKHVK